MPAFNWNEQIQGVPPEWRATLGEGVKIALIDSGIFLDESTLPISAANTFNLTDPDFDIQNRDNFRGGNVQCATVNANNHGTSMASILVGRKDGELGFLGMAPKAELFFFRIEEDSQEKPLKYLALALELACELGVDVIVIPYFPSLDNTDLTTVMSRISHKNILLCCTTKNTSKFSRFIDLPIPTSLAPSIGVGTMNDELLLSILGQAINFPQQLKFVSPRIQVKTLKSAGELQVEDTGSSHAVVAMGGVLALQLAFERLHGENLRSIERSINAIKSCTSLFNTQEMLDTAQIRFFHLNSI